MTVATQQKWWALEGGYLPTATPPVYLAPDRAPSSPLWSLSRSRRVNRPVAVCFRAPGRPLHSVEPDGVGPCPPAHRVDHRQERDPTKWTKGSSYSAIHSPNTRALAVPCPPKNTARAGEHTEDFLVRLVARLVDIVNHAAGPSGYSTRSPILASSAITTSYPFSLSAAALGGVTSPWRSCAGASVICNSALPGERPDQVCHPDPYVGARGVAKDAQEHRRGDQGAPPLGDRQGQRRGGSAHSGLAGHAQRLYLYLPPAALSRTPPAHGWPPG
jgi:hypothetical protein